MRRRYYILLVLGVVLFSDMESYAQNRDTVLSIDSLGSFGLSSSDSDSLFNSIESQSKERKVWRFLHDVLVVPIDSTTRTNVNVVDETKLFRHLEGKTIGKITIDRRGVFDDEADFFERIVNRVHYPTRENAIARDLLIRSGDKVDPDIIVKNKQLLNSRRYIYSAKFIFTPSKEDSTVVDLEIETQDSWTLSAHAKTAINGNSRFEVYDANLLGTGNKLSITTNFNWKELDYGGNVIEYEIPNIAGSFFKGNFILGEDFDNSDYGFTVSKSFILPTDYEMGVELYTRRTPYYLLYSDTTAILDVNMMDVWLGSSQYIESLNSSFYTTVRYGYRNFKERPYSDEYFSPAFHDKRYIMLGVGLYREKFYTSNLIYGFGVKEYLASGFMAEMISGYEWGEFGNDIILGVNLKKGGNSELGYFMGSIRSSTNIHAINGEMSNGVVDISLSYISNLWGERFSRIRQFVTFNYTYGWNRTKGANEIITFTDASGPRAFDEYVFGTNRMVLNSETVFFTPFQPLGFRIALYGFFDIGTLGDMNNPLKNDLYSTIGAGVRVKNDRLIFSTIQLRLGIAIGKNGLLDSDYFRVQSQSRVESIRYLPGKPQPVSFK